MVEIDQSEVYVLSEGVRGSALPDLFPPRPLCAIKIIYRERREKSCSILARRRLRPPDEPSKR